MHMLSILSIHFIVLFIIRYTIYFIIIITNFFKYIFTKYYIWKLNFYYFIIIINYYQDLILNSVLQNGCLKVIASCETKKIWLQSESNLSLGWIFEAWIKLKTWIVFIMFLITKIDNEIGNKPQVHDVMISFWTSLNYLFFKYIKFDFSRLI